MTEYFFDTYAIIEIIKENKAYSKYSKELIITSMLNFGELYYALLKDFNEAIANEWRRILEQTLLLINADIIVNAMVFKHENRNKNFSFIDCVGYVLARENNLTFLTGDKEFKGMANVEFVN